MFRNTVVKGMMFFLLHAFSLPVFGGLVSGPVFKDHPTYLKAFVSEDFSLDLRNLLSDVLLYSARSQIALFDAPFGLQLRQTQKMCRAALKAASAHFFRLPRFAPKCAAKNAQFVIALSVTSSFNVWCKDFGLRSFAAGCDAGDKKLVWFAFDTPPSWLSVDAEAGIFSALPEASQVGTYRFSLSVKEEDSDEGDITQIVLKVKHRPKWIENPVNFGIQFAGRDFSLDLNSKIQNPSGAALLFSSSGIPSWVKLSTGGIVTGKPAVSDIGKYQGIVLNFKDEDGEEGSSSAFGEVQEDPNLPPVIEPEAFSFILKEREVLKININDPKYVHDPDGDPLVFELMESVGWISLSHEGILEMRPLHQQLGSHLFTIKVSEDKLVGGLSETGILNVTVIADPLPPFWIESPIVFKAKVGAQFAGSVRDKADDPDKLFPLVFSLGVGPSWLSMDGEGNMRGTPAKGDLGQNRWPVEVTNSVLLGAGGELIIEVQGELQVDRVQIDSVGAGAEVVWLVNHTEWTKSLVFFLSCHIQAYLDELKVAGVHHVSVYLSANPYWFKARPILGESGNPLMTWDAPDWASDFKDRAWGGWVLDDNSASPLWTLNCFLGLEPDSMSGCYGSNPGISGILHNGFMEKGFPLDVMIIDSELDLYGWWAKKTPKSNYLPADYSSAFLKYFEKEGKNLRISALGYKKHQAEKYTFAAQVLAQKTGGEFFTVHPEFDLPATLRFYARQIAKRAALGKVQRIKLTQVPMEPENIEVGVDSVVLSPGNEWLYDPAANEVILFWEKVDPSLGQIGNTVQVKYLF